MDALANDIEFLASKDLIYHTSSEVDDAARFVESLPFEDAQRQFLIVKELGRLRSKTASSVLKRFTQLQRGASKRYESHLRRLTDSLNETMMLGFAQELFMARVLKQKIQFEGFQATTVCNEFDAFFANQSDNDTSDIVQVVLEKIPLPSEVTPWETILDFRADPSTNEHLNGLRVWMADVSKSNLSKKELDQKLEWLLFQQSQHLRLHRIESSMGVMGSIFVGAMEILEDTAKLKLGSLARSLVSFSAKKAELLKSELSGPSKEVSYLLRVKTNFEK